MAKRAIAFDSRGVIISKQPDKRHDLFYGDRFRETPEVDGALAAIARIVEEFEGQAFIIAKAYDEFQHKTREWQKYHRFHERTGIPPEHIHFCRDRAGKRHYCELLGITHLVDDRLETHSYVYDVVPNLYLFRPSDEEVRKFSSFERYVTPVAAWNQVADLLVNHARVL